MNIKEYLENPMGKGSSAIPNRQLIISDLSSRFNNLMRSKDITLSVYKVNSKDYLYHLIIPTETERGNTYDVVIQFYTEDNDVSKQPSLRNYDIRLFSNAPSFVFTYANAYEKQDMYVSSLKSKLDKDVFKKEPVMRNPYKVISYEKYLFFAMRYILDDIRLLHKDIIDKMSKVYNSVLFKKTIRTVNEVLLEIKKLNLKNRETLKKQRLKDDRQKDKGIVKKKEVKSSVNIINTNNTKDKTTSKSIKPRKKIKKL